MPMPVSNSGSNENRSTNPERILFPGVNVAGYLTAELGVGEAARGYVTALKSLGVETALTDFALGTQSRKEDRSLSDFSAENPYPLNLICVNADQIPNFLSHFGTKYLEQKYNIAVWWWELPIFPEEWRCFAHFSEIWVGSLFAYESISKHSPIPVIKVPPVVKMTLAQAYAKQDFGISENEFVFLFVFDFLSLFARKNPLALIEAFKKAFKPDEPVRLILKCINGECDLANFQQLKDASSEHRITIIDQYLSKDEKNGLLSVCDCYVSLHRSEGFGLTLAEAMLLEKPVIGTGWSGNMDFMTINNSYPVEYKLVAIAEDHGHYKRGQIWAEPSTDHAALLMRQVYTQPQAAQKKAQRACADIKLMHSSAAAAQAMKARLDLIQSSLMLAQQQLDPLSTTPIPEEAIATVNWANESRFGNLGLLGKRIMERLMRFYINYQAQINHDLANSQKLIREETEQQQIVVHKLERKIALLAERVDILQANAHSKTE